ncbi:2Fe-2S iron-sulfur cluster-binding protein [Haloferax namakaokahaiae]|uniref:2Fe-2S iron-sulfur cluster-binding protein n=1 Tax=Haloferax namakaokahaiae TaxID=1748331 RepID=A0ABD5ZDT7_9EURY
MRPTERSNAVDGSSGADADADTAAAASGSVPVTVCDGDSVVELGVAPGTILRDALLESGLSPYTRVTRRANCGGRGLCATCGVRISVGAPSAEHWHDRLADRFGYPRLSCQIRVTEPMTVELVEKVVWGGRER